MQQGEGIRVSSSAVAGGNITVNVGTSDGTVEIMVWGSQDRTSHQVPGNKDASIPLPPVGAGTVIIVTVGKGLRRRRFEVVVVSPGP